MTTPSVTVPVEPTEAMMRAWHRSAWPQGPEVSPMSQAGLAFKRHYAAMLSAAPAPEGGAVSTGAQAVIRNGQIVISVDVDALPLILSGSIALNAVAGTFKVTDAATFAKEVCSALNAEKEDGTTRVHMMFDSAFNHAIDQGAEGVDEINEDEFEAEAARLQAEAQAALTTREEAPAEAGVDALRSHFKAMQVMAMNYLIPEDYRDRKGNVIFQPVRHSSTGYVAEQRGNRAIAFANDMLYMLDGPEERAALRAQPPAREDAQPVDDKALTKAQRSQLFHILRSGSAEVSGSWAAFDALAMRGLIHISEYRIGFYRARATEKALAAYGSELGINALATNPAPDALRVAVEALEKIKARAADDGTGSSVFPEIRNIASKALAVLQAEQKGGA